MEAIKLCRLDTPIIFIEARINLSRFVVTGCAAKTSATVTFPSLRLFFFFQAEDGIRDLYVTGVQTCALPILDRADVLILGGGLVGSALATALAAHGISS